MSKGSRWPVAIAVLSLLVAAYPIWNEWTKSPSLLLTINSSSPLVANLPETDAIQVVASGKAISDPYLVLMTLENDGGIPIRSDDFEGPIDIQVSSANVVSVTEAPTAQRTVRTNISSSQSSVSIAPALFNPGDKLQVAVITSGGKPGITAIARISDIKKVDIVFAAQERPQKRRPFFAALDVLAGLVLAVATGFFYSRTFSTNLDPISLNQGWLVPISWGTFMGCITSLSAGFGFLSEELGSLAVPMAVILIALSWWASRKRRSKLIKESPV